MVDLALAAAQARQLPCLALKDVLICRPGVARERLEVEVKWGNSPGSPSTMAGIYCASADRRNARSHQRQTSWFST